MKLTSVKVSQPNVQQLTSDPVATRRALTQSVSKQNTLERKVLEFEKQLRQRDQKLEDQRIRIETLTNERRILLEGETHEKQVGEERERTWAQEKVSQSAPSYTRPDGRNVLWSN